MQKQPSAFREAGRRRHIDRLAFIALLVVNLAVALFLARQVLDHRAYPFDGDEAAHALPALLMLQDLRAGDWGAFLSEIYNQDFYPPGGAIVLLPAYLVAGPSPVVARLASVGCLFLAVLVLFFLAREIDPRRGAVAGLIAGLLTLTARPLLSTAALVMLEPPGLLVSLLLLWAYVRAARRPAPGRLALVGLLLAATFLTKYTYGLVGLAAVGASELIASLRVRPIRLPRRWIPLFAPFAAVMLVWFARPDKALGFLDYTRPLSSDATWLAFDNLLYYPRSFAIHSGPSAAFVLAGIAALVWAARRWSAPGILAVLLYFLSGMAAMMLLNHPPNPRFIATFAPAAHLLAGLMIVDLAGRASPARGRNAPGIALAAVLLLAVLSAPTVMSRFRYLGSALHAQVETSPAHAELAAWVAAGLPPDASVYLVNYWDQFSRPMLEWALAIEAEARPRPVAGRVLDPATPETTAGLRADVARSGATHLVLVEGGPWGAPFWPDYTSAFGDDLRESGRQTFHLTHYEASEWLDDNTLGPDWEARKAEARETIEIGVIIYEIVP